MKPFQLCSRFRTILFICLIAAIFLIQRAEATIVGIYGSASTGQFAGRVSSMGYDVEFWWLPTQITPASLINIDVLYVQSGQTPELTNEAATISTWVNQGNGLIIEQPNKTGPVAILPASLPISIWSKDYDGSTVGPDPVRNVQVTDTGMLHPVTIGLGTNDICQNYDRVRRSDVAAGYDILGVQISNTNYVAIAAAEYGAGRIVFHTGTGAPNAFTPGSDTYFRQMLDWVGVPEPVSPLLLIFGIAAARRRVSREL